MVASTSCRFLAVKKEWKNSAASRVACVVSTIPMTGPRPASYSWPLPQTINSRVFSIGSFQRERKGPVSLLLRMTTHESAPPVHIVVENRRSETAVLGSMKRNHDLTSDSAPFPTFL